MRMALVAYFCVLKVADRFTAANFNTTGAFSFSKLLFFTAPEQCWRVTITRYRVRVQLAIFLTLLVVLISPGRNLGLSRLNSRITELF